MYPYSPIAGNRTFISLRLVTSPLAGPQVIEFVPHEHFAGGRYRKSHCMYAPQLISYPIDAKPLSRPMLMITVS
jgi:hypothetical protein